MEVHYDTRFGVRRICGRKVRRWTYKPREEERSGSNGLAALTAKFLQKIVLLQRGTLTQQL
jgi:hypothetical protein